MEYTPEELERLEQENEEAQEVRNKDYKITGYFGYEETSEVERQIPDDVCDFLQLTRRKQKRQ